MMMMKLLIRLPMSRLSRTSPRTREQGARCLFGVMVVRNHVSRRRRVKNVLSDDAAEMGRRDSLMRFSTLLKRAFEFPS